MYLGCRRSRNEFAKDDGDSPESRDGGELRLRMDEPHPQPRRIRSLRDLQRRLLLPYVDVVGRRRDRPLNDRRGPQDGREEGHLHD